MDGLPGNHLIVDPTVGFFHSVPQLRGRLPMKYAPNHTVIAISPVHSPGCRQIIGALKLYACDLLNDVDQLINRDQLVATQVYRVNKIAVEDHLGPFNAVVDVHEAACLVSVTPD